MKVSRYSYAAEFPAVDSLLAEIRSMLVTGDYVLGPHVRAFEEDMAGYLGIDHVVTMNSGTDALTLMLEAAGVRAGDEVITVANTFYATVAAVVRTGARPVLVDCRSADHQIDPAAVESAMTPRTRAILAVHLYGRICDVGALRRIADSHGVLLFEDCAQAVGATLEGRRAGTFGDAAAFSFHPSKNLAAAGDGGAVATADPVLAERLRVLRWLGQTEQNEHVTVGYNTKLDALQALVLSAKLPYLDGWNARRAVAASTYASLLPPYVTPVGEVVTDGSHVYHLFQVRTRVRDACLAALREAGVDAVVRYPVPIHLQAAFSSLGLRRGEFPNAERHSRETLVLPIRPDIDEEEIRHVCFLLNAASSRWAGEGDR